MIKKTDFKQPVLSFIFFNYLLFAHLWLEQQATDSALKHTVIAQNFLKKSLILNNLLNQKIMTFLYLAVTEGQDADPKDKCVVYIYVNKFALEILQQAELELNSPVEVRQLAEQEGKVFLWAENV